jgi:predicted amino acid dehydrogenase
MKSFAFIVNISTVKQAKDFWPLLRIAPDFLIGSFLKKLSPFKARHIPKIQSMQGKVIHGYIIASPADKLIAAGRIAEQLGVTIIGLDRMDIGNLKIPVTTGNFLNAWSVVEGVYRMAKIKKLNLKNSTLAIIGATGPIGSICARKLSDYVPKIIIVGKDGAELERLKEKILSLNPVEVIMEEDAHTAVKDADILIDTGDLSEPAFEIEELKSNAIVCDISASHRLFDKPNVRQDITVIRGGLIKMPYPVNLGINTGLPKGIINAPLAETMLLAFRERFVSYSFGDDINLDKLEEIADLSVQHGFEVWVPEAPLM